MKLARLRVMTFSLIFTARLKEGGRASVGIYSSHNDQDDDLYLDLDLDLVRVKSRGDGSGRVEGLGGVG